MSLPPGWTADPFEMVRESGQAWVHPVVRANSDDSRRFALKRLKNPRRRTRFDQEVTVMRELANRGLAVVDVIDVGEHNGRPYYVMPWYGSGSLDAADLGDLSARLELLDDVAGELGALHALGYAHRDIKPENILLDDDRRPMLADFGLCLSLQGDRVTEAGEAVGSRFYIAPENESGVNQDVDQRPADAYAFGKMIWSIATGMTALPRELQLDTHRSTAATLDDDRVNGLDQLCRLLLNPDPRSRLCDWTVIRDEIRAVRRIVEDASSNDAPIDQASLKALVPLLKKLSKVRPAEPYRRAQLEADSERVSCQELSRAFSGRLHAQLDGELAALAPVLEEAGLSVMLNSGGLFLKNVVRQFAPLREQVEIANLRAWAGEQSTMIALYIRGARPPWSPSIWVGQYLVPYDSGVAVARVTTCQRGEHDRPAFVAEHDRWEFSECGRWDLATSNERILEIADRTATFLRGMIRDYVVDGADGTDPSERYLTG